MTQKENNPFKNSDTNKRYFTYDYYMKTVFGRKCFKVPIDAGFTCPNIDGNAGTGGCIYCANGSRSVISDSYLTPRMQYEKEAKLYREKAPDCVLIPYYQSFSCTYAPLEKLKAVYEEALTFPDAAGIAIGTRADCITDENAAYFSALAERTHLTLELGLQTVSDKTAALINRCHTYGDFLRAYSLLRDASDKIRIGVHVILGLPGETKDDVLNTASELSKLRPDEIKIHLLHVLRGTRLADMYDSKGYTPLEKDEYIKLVCAFLELIPPSTVIGRLTGDGDRELLLAPLYSRDKKKILNGIDKYLFEHNTYQGRLYERKDI